ncbi:hypothetical protein [Natronococcus sp. A-GB7]|uniref:DUF7344 domain-containing protein n=1 Tax=Natronococcus sp. A-GB7 TaxID=3037649 RepID=UPI00241E4B12|nr:hypothetical protein [Natronococcus sp. A-GB7]MDG5821231.1 hypothetical protein [Natronococcus sp. A-GB7]
MDQRAQNKEASSTDNSPEARVLSEDDVFHLLNTSRRREVIRCLLETGEPIQLPDLARHVAAAENEMPIDLVTSDQYQRIYVPLYQEQLPKLDKAGVIRYDQSSGVIEPTDRLGVFSPYLEHSPNEEGGTRSSVTTTNSDKQVVSKWYFASAGLSAILLLAVTLELIPIAGELLGAIIIVLFLAANAAARLSLFHLSG